MMPARWTLGVAVRLARVIRRAYLHHLFKAEEMLGPMLLTWHNLRYYQDLMRGLRAAIADHRLDAFAAATRAGWAHEEPS